MTPGGANWGWNTGRCRGWTCGPAMPWRTNPCRIDLPIIWCPPPTAAITFPSAPVSAGAPMTMDLAYVLAYMPDHTVNNSLATGVLPSTFQGRLSHEIVCSLGYKF